MVHVCGYATGYQSILVLQTKYCSNKFLIIKCHNKPCNQNLGNCRNTKSERGTYVNIYIVCTRFSCDVIVKIWAQVQNLDTYQVNPLCGRIGMRVYVSLGTNSYNYCISKFLIILQLRKKKKKRKKEKKKPFDKNWVL